MKLAPILSILIAVGISACVRDDPESETTESAHEAEATVTQQMPGIETAEAAPHRLEVMISTYGTVVPNAERTRNVSARFAGVVVNVAKSPGDRVAAGETLASIESNDSLQVYAVKAPIAGVVTARHINPGETADSQTLFTISDLSLLWAELMVFPREFRNVRVGQPVILHSADGALTARATLAFIAPAGASGTQAVTVRAPLSNVDGFWRPGLNVSASIVVAETVAPVAVLATALQTMDGARVLFVPEGAGFAPRVVQTGQSDDEYVEITAGLAAGERYVARESFLVKAELEKAGAAHEH